MIFGKRPWELVAHLSWLASSRGRWVFKHSAAAHQNFAGLGNEAVLYVQSSGRADKSTKSTDAIQPFCRRMTRYKGRQSAKAVDEDINSQTRKQEPPGLPITAGASVETALMVPDSVRRRMAVPKRLVVQNTRTVRDTRYQTVRNSADLGKRVSDIERLVGFLTDMMFGLISAFFAIVAVAFADSDASWQNTICAGVLAFLISMWIADFLFPNATRWCLK